MAAAGQPSASEALPGQIAGHRGIYQVKSEE
jgi:hypothetical protein